MKTEPQKFVIGERTFYLRPVTLGQLEHLVNVVGALSFSNAQDPLVIIETLAGRLPQAIACVLIEEGKTAGDLVRQLDEPEGVIKAANFFRYEMAPETALEVVTSFLAVNPISSLATRLMALVQTMGTTINVITTNGSNSPTPPSPEETLASAPASGSA